MCVDVEWTNPCTAGMDCSGTSSDEIMILVTAEVASCRPGGVVLHVEAELSVVDGSLVESCCYGLRSKYLTPE